MLYIAFFKLQNLTYKENEKIFIYYYTDMGMYCRIVF